MGRRRRVRGPARRTVRRTARRGRRIRRRRRLLVGGMVVLGVGGAIGAVKMSRQDAQRVEQHTGTSVDELTDEELLAAMKELQIRSAELSPEDKAALAQEATEEQGEAEEVAEVAAAEEMPATAEPEAVPAYIQELEQLARLRDQGIITDEEFQAKKAQILKS